MLSEDGNPRISSLNVVLHALGLRLSAASEKSVVLPPDIPTRKNYGPI